MYIYVTYVFIGSRGVNVSVKLTYGTLIDDFGGSNLLCVASGSEPADCCLVVLDDGR